MRPTILFRLKWWFLAEAALFAVEEVDRPSHAIITPLVGWIMVVAMVGGAFALEDYSRMVQAVILALALILALYVLVATCGAFMYLDWEYRKKFKALTEIQEGEIP